MSNSPEASKDSLTAYLRHGERKMLFFGFSINIAGMPQYQTHRNSQKHLADFPPIPRVRRAARELILHHEIKSCITRLSPKASLIARSIAVAFPDLTMQTVELVPSGRLSVDPRSPIGSDICPLHSLDHIA
jgi:hypothetical protein